MRATNLSGGIFAHASILPVSFAWDAFGIKNGARSLTEMQDRIAHYRRDSGSVVSWLRKPLVQKGFGDKRAVRLQKTIAMALPGFQAEVEREGADEHIKAMTADAFALLLFNPQEHSPQKSADNGKGESWISKILGRSRSDEWCSGIPASIDVDVFA